MDTKKITVGKSEFEWSEQAGPQWLYGNFADFLKAMRANVDAPRGIHVSSPPQPFRWIKVHSIQKPAKALKRPKRRAKSGKARAPKPFHRLPYGRSSRQLHLAEKAVWDRINGAESACWSKEFECMALNAFEVSQ